MIHRHYCADLYGKTGEYRKTNGDPVSKTMFYTQYLKDLRIEPLDDNGRSYVTHDQKQLLDEYHKRRSESKQALIEFLTELNATVPNDSELVAVPNGSEPLWLPFLEALTPRLAPPPDLLSPQKQLQEIADRHWQVSSSQLKTILKLQSIPPNRYGFTFTKVGRSGRELSWMVQKF